MRAFGSPEVFICRRVHMRHKKTKIKQKGNVKIMKKKILLVGAMMVLVALAAVGVTMAYLTSTDEATNTFTVGNVAITLDEAKVYTDGTPVENADRVQENSYKLIPGHEYTKDPTVHVSANSEPCYLRAKVTITNGTAWTGIVNKYAGNKMENIILGFDENLWWVSDPALYSSADTVTYTFIYKDESKTEAEKRICPAGTNVALFTGIKMPGGITADELKSVENTKITVKAEAIQADGFVTDTNGNAWDKAFSALDEASK